MYSYFCRFLSFPVFFFFFCFFRFLFPFFLYFLAARRVLLHFLFFLFVSFVFFFLSSFLFSLLAGSFCIFFSLSVRSSISPSLDSFLFFLRFSFFILVNGAIVMLPPSTLTLHQLLRTISLYGR